MAIRILLFVPVMLLAACSSKTATSTGNNTDELSSLRNDSSVNQRSNTDGEYIEIANAGNKTMVNHNDVYYKAKANVTHTSNSKQIKINVDDILITIKLIDYNSYLDFKKGNRYLNRQTQIDFNYTYDTDLKSAIQQIKVFKHKNLAQGLLILPSFTEEYPTYTILPFDGTGIKHFYTAEVQSFDCNDFDSVTLGTVTAESILISQKDKSCKVTVYENKEIENLTIANNKDNNKSRSEQPRALNSTELTQMYDNDLYEFYNFDVNADGIKDKIITHQNDEKNFHQGSDLYVYLGDKNNKYKLSIRADNYTDETGWFLGGIVPRNNRQGFILENFYSPRGHSEQSFYFRQQDDNWIIRKYVSEGTLISGQGYYCVENHIASLSNRTYGKSSEYSESEFIKYCPPLATSYQVTVNKAEILDQNFDPQVPPNYYIKDDIIEVFSQNEDWIEVSYKNNTKRGWVDKRNVKAVW